MFPFLNYAQLWENDVTFSYGIALEFSNSVYDLNISLQYTVDQILSELHFQHSVLLTEGFMLRLPNN